MKPNKKCVQPLGDWILIERENPTKTEGGLHIPDQFQDTTQIRGARVVAVGPGRVSETGHFHTPKVRVGDIVWLDRNPTIAVLPFCKDAVLVREHSIVCTIREGGSD